MMGRLTVRSIFSDAALDDLGTDDVLVLDDRDSGVELRFWWNSHDGGTLRLAGGALGSHGLRVTCDRDELNAVASLMLSGLKARL